MPTLPFCLMTKRLRPDDDAVKISPTPELSTTRVAKEVAPEILAAGAVPTLRRTSRVASGEAVLMPTLPVLSISKRVVVASSLLLLILKTSLLSSAPIDQLTASPASEKVIKAS